VITLFGTECRDLRELFRSEKAFGNPLGILDAADAFDVDSDLRRIRERVDREISRMRSTEMRRSIHQRLSPPRVAKHDRPGLHTGVMTEQQAQRPAPDDESPPKMRKREALGALALLLRKQRGEGGDRCRRGVECQRPEVDLARGRKRRHPRQFRMISSTVYFAPFERR